MRSTSSELGVILPFFSVKPFCPTGNERRANTSSAFKPRITCMRVCGVILALPVLAVLSAQSDRVAKTTVRRRVVLRSELMMYPAGLHQLYVQAVPRTSLLRTAIDASLSRYGVRGTRYQPRGTQYSWMRPSCGWSDAEFSPMPG